MSNNECCSTNEENCCEGVRVTVNVDVPKIVKYCCITGVLIVGIIFGTKCFRKMLDEGFFTLVDE